jgi:DDE superfamily endonuclease
VSENKTGEGINRLFVLEVRNQSSLKRLLTASPFSVEAVKEARLALRGSLAGTQLKPQGGLSLDDTLLTPYGRHFEKIASLYDSTQGGYVWAPNLVNLHYSEDLTDYPIAFRLWEPAAMDALEAGLKAPGVPLRDGQVALKQADPPQWRQSLLGVWRRQQHKPGVQQLYQSKWLLAQQLLTPFVAAHAGLALPATFDNWYPQPAFCRFLHRTLRVPSVGTLAEADQVLLASGATRLDAVARHLQAEHQAALTQGQNPLFHTITIRYKGAKETYYSYCHPHRIQHFGKQRLVINPRQADLSDTAKFFISNQLHWQAPGITRLRRHRWPVEVSHEEGKAEGLDQYQVRDFAAISRHTALVAVTYSLRRATPHDPAVLHTLQRQIRTTLDGSAGSCRRHTQAQALWALATFIATALAQGQSLREVRQPLLAAVAY